LVNVALMLINHHNIGTFGVLVGILAFFKVFK